MANTVLHEGASVLCSHGAESKPMMTDSRVKVDGQAVVTQSSTYTVSGCPFTSGGSPMPCVTAQWLSASARVFASNQPLILNNSQSQTVPNATPLTISSTQNKVSAQ